MPDANGNPTPEELIRQKLAQALQQGKMPAPGQAALGGTVPPALAPQGPQDAAPQSGTPAPTITSATPQGAAPPKPPEGGPKPASAYATGQEWAKDNPDAVPKPPPYQKPSFMTSLRERLAHGMMEFGRPGAGINAAQQYNAEQKKEKDASEAATRNLPQTINSQWQTAKDKEATEAQAGATLAKTRAETANLQAEATRNNRPPAEEAKESTLKDLMSGGDNHGPRINPDTNQPYTTLEAYRAVESAGQEGKDAPLDANTISQVNAASLDRYRILNPGKPLPPEFTAQPGITAKGLDRIERELSAVESAQGIQAVRDQTIATQKQRDDENRKKQTTEERAIEAAAQSLAGGDLTRLMDISSFRNDQRLLIYARAKEINPAFNTAELDRKIKTVQLYTTGKQGDQLQSFGTFLEHAGALKDTMDALQGVMSSKLLNHGINWLRKNVNDDPAYPKVLAALDPVQKEFESYLLNNRAMYAGDRETVEQIISGDLPLSQMNGALQQMGHTVQARYNEAGKRFKNTVGKSLDEMGLGPTEEALDAAKKIGITVGTGSGNAPSGKGGSATSGFAAWDKAHPQQQNAPAGK